MKSLYSILIAILALVVFAPLSAVADTWGDQINDTTRFVFPPGYTGLAVLDRETGLVWELTPDTGGRNWIDAQIFCNTRNIANRKGWRLPTIQEFASLVDPSQTNPALPAGHPFNMVQFSFDYWSATTFASNTGWAWFVFLGNGGVFADVKSNSSLRAWCVRGGQGVNPQ